ncbi:hypothetical protein [Microbacterium hydrocarbonoxydans]|uniref:hypothetical protein n=1 Tax=Microbacterium hydrocarbonoxydans TaxID=273678 RepID=UPI003D977ACC
MTELLLGGVAVVSLGFNARTGWQWARDWPMERRELKQRMLASLPEDFLDRVLREHDWRVGDVPMGRVKFALRLYGRDA